MRYGKNSIDYQINVEAFHEMEHCVPMTTPERDALRNWDKKGYDLDPNPWNLFDSDDLPLNYLQAYRLEFGYSSGPWDYWKGPDTQTYWDESRKCFIPKDEFC